MTVLNPITKAEVATICSTSAEARLNPNFVFALIEYVERLEAVALQADSTVDMLRSAGYQGVSESLNRKIRQAIDACNILNTCKPQRTK
jgi:hypothetical protein